MKKNNFPENLFPDEDWGSCGHQLDLDGRCLTCEAIREADDDGL